VRDFVDKELRPFADEWDEGKSFPVEEVRKKAHRAGVLAPWAPAEVPTTAPKPPLTASVRANAVARSTAALRRRAAGTSS
jgi:alkylation response protein AidB-like acyl-CoA dehydrogenase